MQSLSELLRHACGADTGHHHSPWRLQHKGLVAAAWVLMALWSRSAGGGHPSPVLLSRPSRPSWVRQVLEQRSHAQRAHSQRCVQPARTLLGADLCPGATGLALCL